MRKIIISLFLLFLVAISNAQILRQNIAVDVIVGPLVDCVDGKTPVEVADTNLWTAAIYKNAVRTQQTFTVSEVNDGYWQISLSAIDTNTAGNLKITLRDEDVFLAAYADFTVLAANVYDSQMGTDYLKTDIVEVNGTAVNDINDFQTNVSAVLTLILADTNELQTDWRNGGRLDLLLDSLFLRTGRTLEYNY